MISRLASSFVAVAGALLVATCASDVPVVREAAQPAMRFSPHDVERGRALALIGNCNVCHTTENGASFAGGRALPTPFGTIYSTNITPDPQTGIGSWSLDDFRRAMHEGIAPGSRQLYPAFPYDHYALVADADVDAIYAYVMTRQAVVATAPANDLRMPFGARGLIAFWKQLYFHPEAVIPDPNRSAAWNRGRYLVEGLGHCGACHSPRNHMGAELRARDLDGGEAEGWHAPALDENSRAPVRWTEDALVTYLRSGFDERHGASRGPMAPVTQNLAQASESDVRAIATYIASRAGSSHVGASLAVTRVQVDDATRAELQRGDGASQGAILYEGACAGCHDRALRGVRLEDSTAVTDSVPTNMIRVITDGLVPVEGEPSRSMPGFRGTFTAGQTAALVQYIRARYSRAEPWQDVQAQVDRIRAQHPSGSAS